MTKSQVNIRLEDTLINALKARSEAERVTVTDLVAKYIQLGLEQPAEAPIAASDFRKLESRLSALETEMGKVRTLIAAKTEDQANQSTQPEQPYSRGIAPPLANQPVDISEPLETEWNVYLHHPRGTVERIVGPFLDEKQARSQMSLQMDFGLFPESKGYRWECKEESRGRELEDLDDEPDEVLLDFLEPGQALS